MNLDKGNNSNKFVKAIALFVISISGFRINLVEAVWKYETKYKACATIYTDVDFGGFKKAILDTITFTDLSNFYLKPISKYYNEATKSSDCWKHKISSITIEPGCQLQICLETQLGGSCTLVSNSTANLDLAWRQNVSSLECRCPAYNCEAEICSNIKLTESECARGFFEPNCSTCAGKHLTILPGDKAFLGSFMQNISSVFVKSGCKFGAFTANNFTGEVVTLHSEFNSYWDPSLRIGSYKCSCHENITMDVSSIYPKFSRDSPLINLPISENEIAKMTQLYPNHTGLAASKISSGNGRSPIHAYILVIGLTKSGKSSTINLMIGRNITVRNIDNCTIHEYQIPIQVDELGCSNCELRIIDTPGFGESEGYDQDANFLAGLEEYLRIHEELRSRIPNVVLVFSKFNDNRLSESSSPFVKVLRGIDFFRDNLFDLEHSNAVTVLTHFMSQNESVRRNPANKINQFRTFIEEYTLFPKPLRISVAENHPDDLPMINGFYYFPNREYYPRNVFQKMAEATGTRDPLGEAIIRNVFNGNMKHVKFTTTPFHMCGRNIKNRQYYYDQLNLNIQNTGVSKRLDLAYGEMDEELKTKFPQSLEYLKRIFGLHKIFELSNMPGNRFGRFQLFQNITQQNPLVLKLMEKAFNLRIPQFGINVVAGQSYNILTDSVLQFSPFMPYSLELEPSEIGFRINGSVTSQLLEETVNIYNWNDTDKQYREYRRTGNGQGIRADLKGEIRPGYNTHENYGKQHLVSALKEFRTFKLTLKDNLTLDQDFQSRLQTISLLDRSNQSSVDEWRRFFNQYGTHVVKSVFGGGSIEAIFSLKSPGGPPEDPVREFNIPVQNFFEVHDNKYKHKNTYSKESMENVTYSLVCSGGDERKHINSILMETNAKNLDSFLKSLVYQPKILRTSMELIPINEIVQNWDIAIFNKMNPVLEAFLNGELKYKRPIVYSTDFIKYTREGFALQIANRGNDKPKLKKNRNKG